MQLDMSRYPGAQTLWPSIAPGEAITVCDVLGSCRPRQGGRLNIPTVIAYWPLISKRRFDRSVFVWPEWWLSGSASTAVVSRTRTHDIDICNLAVSVDVRGHCHSWGYHTDRNGMKSEGHLAASCHPLTLISTRRLATPGLLPVCPRPCRKMRPGATPSATNASATCCARCCDSNTSACGLAALSV
jgi:hypothetical protein